MSMMRQSQCEEILVNNLTSMFLQFLESIAFKADPFKVSFFLLTNNAAYERLFRSSVQFFKIVSFHGKNQQYCYSALSQLFVFLLININIQIQSDRFFDSRTLMYISQNHSSLRKPVFLGLVYETTSQQGTIIGITQPPISLEALYYIAV